MRRHWLMGVVMVGMLALAGCGGQQSANTSIAPSTNETITVSAAASMQGALEELKADYVKQHNLKPEQVNIVYAGSGTLRQQIEEGAPSSIFISANKKNMDQLNEKGLMDKIRPFVANTLVMIVPKGKEAVTLDNITNAKRVAIGTIETVPAGKYAKDSLTKANLWDAVEPNVVFAKDVKAVGAYIAEGAADVGFVYKTDALALKDKVDISAIVDAKLHGPIEYPIGIVKKNQNKLTEDFYAFLTSKEASEVLAKWGFSDPAQQ